MENRKTSSVYSGRPNSLRLLQGGPPGEISSICCVGKDRVIGVTSEGRVFEWNRGQPRIVDGLTGITVTTVRSGGSRERGYYFCLVTDRGILLTYGRGNEGCLGHGDRRSLSKPKIVEDSVTKRIIRTPNSKFFKKKCALYAHTVKLTHDI